MKKTILFVLLAVGSMVFVTSAKAQLKFGVKGGVNIASVHFNSDVIKPSNVTGFQIGPMIEAMIPVAGFGLDAAVLYSQKGLEEGTSSMKTDYIDVPVNLKWKAGLPVLKVYLAAGPYVGFRVGGDKIWNVLQNQVESKSFSAGLNFGGGVELLKHLQVGVNYSLGLTENYSVTKIDMSNVVDNGKNRTWSITAAILF